jgi:plastocyanin
MTKSRLPFLARALGATVAVVAVVGCGSSSGAGWTFAPLGPTQAPGPSGGTASPGGTPAGLEIDVSTEQANPLAFEPATLNAPPETVVTVVYTNNSSLEHNINFFNGPDQTAPSLGATERVTGPNAVRSVTFTTPSTPGDYYFWCDVHLAAMSGTLHVE